MKNSADKSIKKDLNPDDTKVSTYRFTYDRTTTKQDVTLPVQTDSGTIIGAVVIPGGVMPKGATVTIRQSNNRLENTKSECGDSLKVKGELQSPAWEIDVKGGPSKRFRREVQLRLLTQLPDSFDEDQPRCIAYTESTAGDTSDWKCVDGDGTKGRDQVNRTGNGVGIIETATDHFTTFAVLFGEISYDDATTCQWDWLWIACLVSAATVLSCSILIILMARYNNRVHYWVFGWNDETEDALRDMVTIASQKSQK